MTRQAIGGTVALWLILLCQHASAFPSAVPPELWWPNDAEAVTPP